MESLKVFNRVAISVIVPVYNVKPYLEKCVKSILNQSFNDFEIILVDDGSTDGSADICDKLAKIDSKIKVIHKENQGLGMARNTGLENASGEYIYFIDSDDYIAENAFEELFKLIDNRLPDAIYFGMNKVINGIAEKGGNIPKRLEYEGEDVLKEFFLNAIGGFPRDQGNEFTGISAWCAIFRHDTINKNGLRFKSEREVLSEDIIFNLNFCSKATFIKICPQHLYYYVFREKSLTNSYRKDRFNASKNMQSILTSHLKEYGINCENDFRQNLYFLVNLIVCVKQEVANAKNITFKTAMKNIKSLCNDSLTCSILKDFPLSYLSFSLRIWFVLIKKKTTVPLFILTKLQIYRNQKWR